MICTEIKIDNVNSNFITHDTYKAWENGENSKINNFNYDVISNDCLYNSNRGDGN